MAQPAPALRDDLNRHGDDLIALRRDLHRHPELAFQERRTAAIVAERLHRAGLEVTTDVAGTGVVGVLRGDRPGRTVAWRADMDALPLHEAVDSQFRSVTDQVMHACGHDGHTAIAVILAEVMAARRASLPGSAVFLFQPAEEVFGGARPMIEAGVLDRHGVEEIYGLHLTSRIPVGHIEARSGISMASSDFLEIEVTGRGGHGASPHLAVDPIAIAAQILIGLPQLVASTVPAQRAAVLTIGQLSAGTAANIIPESALMRGSMRTLNASDRRELLERISAYVQAMAAAQRARAVLRTPGESCPPLVNHEHQTQLVCGCARDELGAAGVEAGEPVLASDDMSLFLEARPGCYFRVGAAPQHRPPPPHHSPDFEIDEGGLAVGARVAASVLLHALAP
ncbi:MAG TPA: M20 family metallopeptidase [Kofleriaceae bacterium]|nr:M20 family metallopeptidase [Kofleriaceae bacterium]